MPGWYPHADYPGALRYWDGGKWTDSLAPRQGASTPGIPDWVTTVGYLTAFFFPIAGLVIGCYHLTNNQRGAGAFMCVTSVLMIGLGALWYLQGATAI